MTRLRGIAGAVRTGLVVSGGVAASTVAVLAVLIGGGGSGGGSCTGADVTTGTFSARISAATAGDVLCLDTGNYGNFAGAAKTSPGVTIKAQTGQSPKMVIDFGNLTSAAWLTIDGVNIGGGLSVICGPAHNITIKNATVSYQMYLETGVGPSDNNSCPNATAMHNNAIVIDNDTFDQSEQPTGPGQGHEGRLEVLGGTVGVSPGITIQNNTFIGNCADGIEANAQGGFQVIGNTFKNLVQGSCAPHVDSFSLSNTHDVTARNNYFINDQSGIVQYDDGATGAQTNVNTTVTNNVFDTIPPGPPDVCDAVCVCKSTGLTVTHNTFRNASMVNCSTANPSGNVTARDNVFVATPDVQGASTFSALDHNLCATGTCTGTGSLNGTPTWVGGAAPTTYAGFALASGLGVGAASDGTNMGVNP